MIEEDGSFLGRESCPQDGLKQKMATEILRGLRVAACDVYWEKTAASKAWMG